MAKTAGRIDNIINAVLNKQNILIHAPGGVGKTWLLKKIAEKCLESKKKIGCVAPTGVAALGLSIKTTMFAMSGSTIHSWSGIGLGDGPVEKLLEKVLKWPGSRAKWLNVDILIIDEISMLGAELLDKLDYIGKRVRRNTKPFGGIQIVMGGDFLQLPPVKEKWAFKAVIWAQLGLRPFSLYEPQRYPDINWFHLLLRVRKAQHTQEDIKFLFSRVKAYEKWRKDMENNTDAAIIKPTVLHSTRADVDFDNEIELNKLDPKSEIVFTATDIFTPFNTHGKKEYYLKTLEDAIPKSITLRVGAQVMLKANLDTEAGYVNGSRGVVVRTNEAGVMVKWMNGCTTQITPHTWTQEDKDGKMVRQQIPLILAWALTIHKSQGGTLDYAICNLGPTVFSPGQAYVALSRVRSSEGLLIESLYPKGIKADPEALSFAEDIENRENEDNKNDNIEDTKDENDGDILSGEQEVEVIYVMRFVGRDISKKKPQKYESITPPKNDPVFDGRVRKLREWRYSLAQEANIPAYRIINNTCMYDICYYKPMTLENLGKIKGIGPASIEAYGSDILKVIHTPEKRMLPKNTATY